MRYRAIATDPLDLSRAFRLALGLDAEVRAEDPVVVAAVPALDGPRTLELMSIASDGGKPIVVQLIRIPHKADAPAEIVIFEPVHGSVLVRMGLTLWAGLAPSAPVLVVDRDGGGCEAITARGLERRAGPPLGLEASTATGMDRAVRRIADAMLAIGGFRDVAPMAA